MKTLIKDVALELIRRNGTTTTLEVKQELIATQPTYFWKQNFVSATLMELADNGELNFTDNGTFRVYESPNVANSLLGSMPSSVIASVVSKYTKIPLAQRNVTKVSLTDLARLVQENAGKFITLVHKKKTTGVNNVMNCQVLKGLTPLGAVQVKESGQLKTIYPNTLLEVRVQGTVYQLK